MTKILIDRATVEQALEALELYVPKEDYENRPVGNVIDALRAALAEPDYPLGQASTDVGVPVYVVKKAEPVQEPVACLIGTKGSAFDLPTTKRAYTYAKQPGNVVASRLGLACNAAASQSAGDSIDRGLGLLQELQRQGFGVFDLGAEYTAPPQRPAEPVTDKCICNHTPLTDDQLDDIAVAARRGNLYDLRIAIERALKIGGKE